MSLRESPLGELKVPLTWTAGIAVVVAAVAVIAVLVSDRRETFRAEAYGATRGVADRVMTPVGDALSAPGRWTGAGVDAVKGYFFAVSENHRLKAELKEMRQWRDVALALRNENARYRTLLGLKTDPPIPMVAARVVLDSRGPFANTRLANAGIEKGVKVGNPVMSENGLVGRIMGVTTGASRVLLLTDTASKVPVMIDRTNARAILTGDGGPNPKLEYLRGQDPVKEGDRVMTSGDGGVMPRGLPVGTAVKGLDGRWRVVLASDKAPIDFVRILFFEDFTQLVNQKQLAEKHVPPPTAGAQTVGVAPASATPAPSTTAPASPKPAASPAIAPAAAGPKPAEVKKPADAKTTVSAKPAPGAAAPKAAASSPAKPTAKASGAQPTKGEAAATTTKSTSTKPTAPKPAAAKPAATRSAAPKPPASKPAASKPAAVSGADAEPPH
ncbi:rod shape-determining protein MreC [Phenylobacterium soli]|uniref:Cell shape-determining protein MreC n=1 Tax=Phenylobacterium soli TaxID=2170551 RepID=A0A328AIZ1_9CAUL|nr:rod shape-determining protein MreC [Phenylobacterium soli]